MQDFLSDFTSAPWLPIPTTLMRLLAALVCGALIGYERERMRRPAGLRTHMLVSLAAAAISILSIELVHFDAFQSSTQRFDPIRVVEAVTSGVAFLAAGLIVFNKGRVRNLTTGAGMWLAGAVGMACGLGLPRLAVMTTLLAITVLWVIGILEDRMVEDSRRRERTDAQKASEESE